MQRDIKKKCSSLLGQPQQQWQGSAPHLMQVALFAGHGMIAITDDAGAFELDYLGFTAGGFPTIEAAKASAPEFAQSVLEHMRNLIQNI